MGTIFRDMLRKKIGIRSDVVFVPMYRNENEEKKWEFLNYRNMAPSFPPLVDDKLKSNYMVLKTFSDTFRQYVMDHNGKAYFFYCGKGHNGHLNEKYAGSIWEFDISNPKNQWLNDKDQSSYYFYLTDADGNEFAITFDNHTLHTQEIQCGDLLFLENYTGEALSNRCMKSFNLCDKFLEPLKEGDVLTDGKYVFVLTSISMIEFRMKSFLIKEKGRLVDSESLRHPVLAHQYDFRTDRDNYELINGENHFVLPYIKAPDHIASKVLEWKLSQ